MGWGCKESLGINLKARKRLRLELDLEPGTSVVCVIEELRKKVDIFGVLYKRYDGGDCAHFIGVEERRHKLWWSGNNTGKGGVGILVKEDLCESVVEIRRSSDKTMTMCLIFGEEMI